MSVKPEDVLPEGEEYAEFGGMAVRKGSIAAFIGNVRALAEAEPNSPQWHEVVSQLRELKPAMENIGVLEVFQLRDPEVRVLVDGL